jgi:hypothetical protein
MVNKFIWFRIESVAGSCEHGNELSGSKKGGEFLDQMSDCTLYNDYSAP